MIERCQLLRTFKAMKKLSGMLFKKLALVTQKVAVKTWSKDVVCLPVDYHDQTQELPFPRGNRRAQV